MTNGRGIRDYGRLDVRPSQGTPLCLALSLPKSSQAAHNRFPEVCKLTPVLRVPSTASVRLAAGGGQGSLLCGDRGGEQEAWEGVPRPVQGPLLPRVTFS